jgi:hypothetical protein
MTNPAAKIFPPTPRIKSPNPAAAQTQARAKGAKLNSTPKPSRKIHNNKEFSAKSLTKSVILNSSEVAVVSVRVPVNAQGFPDRTRSSLATVGSNIGQK